MRLPGCVVGVRPLVRSGSTPTIDLLYKVYTSYNTCHVLIGGFARFGGLQLLLATITKIKTEIRNTGALERACGPTADSSFNTSNNLGASDLLGATVTIPWSYSHSHTVTLSLHY